MAVRSLSLMRASILTFLGGEVVTGLLICIILSLIALPAIWLAFGDVAVAAAVSLSLVSATGIAALAGLLLPWLFDRLGFDPALASGPLATVVQDVATLAIYLPFARLIVF